MLLFLGQNSVSVEMLVLVHGFTDFSIWSADSVASGLVINRVSYQKAVVEQQTDHLLVARKQRDKQKGTRMTVAKPPFAKVHKCNADSCPYGEAWRIGSPYGKDLQNLLAFPEGMLGSLLPCVCRFLALLLAVFTDTLSVTDVSLESEKESSSHDSLLFISEDCGSRRDPY